MNLQDALDNAEFVFKKYVFEYIDFINLRCSELGVPVPSVIKKHNMLAKTLCSGRLADRLQRQSIFYKVAEKRRANLTPVPGEKWFFELDYAEDREAFTPLTDCNKFARHFVGNADRTSEAMHEFQELVNSMFVSIAIAHSYFAAENEIFNHIQLVSYQKLGRMGIQFVNEDGVVQDEFRFNKFIYVKITSVATATDVESKPDLKSLDF